MLGMLMIGMLMQEVLMDRPSISENSPAWMAFVWISFAMSIFLTCAGIYNLPSEIWVKGYMLMGLFFSVGASFTLAKQ